MSQYEIKITGRVQGVWFRKYTEEKAKMLNIKGWVKNTADGGVLVVAQGMENNLNTFLDYLKIGPPMARVDNLFKSKIDVSNEFDNFSIKY